METKNLTTVRENPDENQLIISRNFNAPLNLVWRAWTEPEILDKWFAPEPWKSVTKHMDFKEGGHRLYYMQGPEGEKHWGKMMYIKIVPEDFFNAEDGFCDENGNINEEMPSSHWNVVFTESETGTTVVGTTTFASTEALKQSIEMGVVEGTKICQDQLAELLKELLTETQNG